MSAPETCKRGHPWTPENTGLTGGGRRFCRECSRARSRAARARLTGQPCMGCYRERAERAEAARDALAALLSAVREAAEFGDEVDEPGTARAILRILDGGADRG